jgi:hypothetical protein
MRLPNQGQSAPDNDRRHSHSRKNIRKIMRTEDRGPRYEQSIDRDE